MVPRGLIFLLYSILSVESVSQEYIFSSSTVQKTIYVVTVDPLDASKSPVQPLIENGLVEPCGVAFDATKLRLFVADPGQKKIVWYALQQLTSERLVTNGEQYTAVDRVISSDISVDDHGHLYFTGTLDNVQSQPTTQIYKLTDDSISMGQAYDPILLWTNSYSGGKLSNAGPISARSSYIYWGNTNNGYLSGSVVRGPSRPAHMGGEPSDSSALITTGLVFGQGEDSLSDNTFLDTQTTDQTLKSGAPTVVAQLEGAHKEQGAVLSGVSTKVKVLADDRSGVKGLTEGGKYVFYSSGSYVYGADKTNGIGGCNLNTHCSRVTKLSVLAGGSQAPQGLAYDGKNTVYVADSEKVNSLGTKGGIFKFPAGDRLEHDLVEVAPLVGVNYVCTALVGRKVSEGAATNLKGTLWIVFVAFFIQGFILKTSITLAKI